MNEGLPLVHSFYTCTSWLLTADFVGYDLMTGWGALSPTRFAAGLRLGGSKAHNRKPEKAALAQSPWVHRAVDGDVSTPLQHKTQRRKLNHLFFVWLCFCRYSELAMFIPSQICHEKKKKLCSHVTFCWWPRISAFKRCSTWWCKLSPTLSLEVSWTNWKPCRSADPQISTAALWLLFRWATKRLVNTNPTGRDLPVSRWFPTENLAGIPFFCWSSSQLYIAIYKHKHINTSKKILYQNKDSHLIIQLPIFPTLPHDKLWASTPLRRGALRLLRRLLTPRRSATALGVAGLGGWVFHPNPVANEGS